MDERLRTASVTGFYFDAKVIADPTSPEAITIVSHRSYRNLSGALHGIGTHPDRDTLMKDAHASLFQFITELETDPLPSQNAEVAQNNFDGLHDTWCLNRISVFMASPHFRSGKLLTFTYGHAQKWINMTLKYLSVLGHPTALDVYPYLHIPIDSIIYEEAESPAPGLGVSRPPGGVCGSKLNRDQYWDYQQHLRAAIASDHDGLLAPLDWEAQALLARSSQKR